MRVRREVALLSGPGAVDCSRYAGFGAERWRYRALIRHHGDMKTWMRSRSTPVSFLISFLITLLAGWVGNLLGVLVLLPFHMHGRVFDSWPVWSALFCASVWTVDRSWRRSRRMAR